MEYLDMLAKLGIGNAHPGGFAATLKQFEMYPLSPSSRILEVGCGTGRTACHAAALGHEVTGLDIRPDMIAKAKLRAEEGKLPVRFMTGDAAALPFPDGSFDTVLVESVTVFADTAAALSEYLRVLRPGGRLFDREMVQRGPIPPDIREEIIGFYRMRNLWDKEAWTRGLQSAGFAAFQIDGPFPFPEASDDLTEHPDPEQQIDAGSFLDPVLWEVTRKYHEIMERYNEYIGYVLLVGTK
ncbi:class I SAM-dependent methyltransferase [Gorillibacterium sp. sgz5001074]|uniref:class I SAM-dependent methyltransferase n=1 Tax=Gorillibacterium sp. sgz5001074 TaxID=3446695 RepID=UPI003F6697B8